MSRPSTLTEDNAPFISKEIEAEYHSLEQAGLEAFDLYEQLE